MKSIRLIILILCSFSFTVNATIKIGTPIFAPPFVLNNGIYAEGFDIDLMNALCKRLQWQCEFIPMKFYELFPALEQSKIDFAIGAMVISPEGESEFLYSVPYMISEGGFLLLADSPIKSLNDLQGKRVGALKGREYINFLYNSFPIQITVVPYQFYDNLMLDLKNNKIDAVFINYYGSLYLEHQYPEKIRALKEHFQVGEGIGIVTMPTNKDKMDKINNLLLQFQSDGTFIKLYNYNFQFFIAPLTSDKPQN